ncbi:hypothetical protein AM493_01185 [Flavobacterium akiainvivens]|uniref:Uncharacterized protein n=1 Tax=Flavobacterium akiainvivens TaxID=1202724 RepID=A0A0M9VH18_9FLAO|nr:hypothetical protein [Flavobacterium akiainvivens]KOS04809.1 hypothetical protein AM493_01185 [Flavobacterium akiainvivens]SFQ43849.1 hypothetical protein SAMN05444144_104290 [Flavobacterium akiainvivens]
MKTYYVNNNSQPNGDHEVHESGCSFMPSDKKNLGQHPSCKEAVAEAKKTYSKSDGCWYCCPSCHKS